ncbi:MAG: chemotaxis protein CheW [Treponema sp.]|jgi:purine-binding chemotaxis protein CheW|nr:chemotaxis protein CheW [Treponema sp.]
MAAEIKDLAEVNADLQIQKERAEMVDFKIITFSLGGKDYGVDIMNVKEIAKADKFTYVPNAASFVKGVYNLRGDIIPIIDLRSFFHLPQEKKADGLENMLILRIEDRVYGTVVDKIDRVIGINSSSVQPPHPIFGDINIKYISGVVEKSGNLYVILDVIRIFSQHEDDKQKGRMSIQENTTGNFVPPPSATTQTPEQKVAAADTALGFIKESLAALKHFYASGINDAWVHKRFIDWSATHREADVQLRNASDAEEFLADFPSPYTGQFWDDEYAGMVQKILPDMPSSNIQVWNPGCGKGHETYSFACLLKARYPDAHIKIWASDNDILAISNAPNMSFDLNEVPEYCRAFMLNGKGGYVFKPVIKDAVVFEYHDILNEAQLPDLDIILMRDLLSYLPVAEQSKQLASFGEKLKKTGALIVGKNEVIADANWRSIGEPPLSVFIYNG